MPESIDHDDVRRLIAEERAQLVEVLPAKEFAEEHITGAITSRSRSSTNALRASSTACAR